MRCVGANSLSSQDTHPTIRPESRIALTVHGDGLHSLSPPSPSLRRYTVRCTLPDDSLVSSALQVPNHLLPSWSTATAWRLLQASPSRVVYLQCVRLHTPPHTAPPCVAAHSRIPSRASVTTSLPLA